MSCSFKKIMLLVLFASLINSSLQSLVSASDFMPADCMMAMMDDDDAIIGTMDDCNCSVDGMQCQRCDADFLSNSSAVVASDSLLFNTVNNDSFKTTTYAVLASISLAHPSPPPIL